MKTKILQRLLLLLLFMIGAGDTWAETFTPDVKMTYVNYDEPDRSFGEIPSYSAARAGYNGISGGNVVFPRTDWRYNYITYIQVDASLITGTITNATLTAQVSGAIDGTRSTGWGVGYNNSVWSSNMTYNTADKSITTIGELQYTGVTTENDFEYKSFDITSAFYNDEDKIVTIVVYETVGGAGYIANPTVTLTYTPATEVAYIEDISFNLTTVCKATNASYSVSTDGYLRMNGNNAYPIKTTGSDATNTTEGAPIYVTAYKDGKSSTFALRIKTRNILDPSPMIVDATNTFEAGSTLGMFTEQRVYLNGMTLYLGYQGHTPVVRSVNGDYGLTIIDSNGWTFGNYDQEHEWGTVYKIETSQAKNMTVSGYFASTSSNALQLYDNSGNAIGGKSLSNPGDGSLVTATFALNANQWYLLYVHSSVFALKSLSYGDAYFNQYHAITTVGSNYTQQIIGMANPNYSIVGKEGDIASTGVTINSSTGEISNITAGGALKIQATNGGQTCYYYLTIAYPATPYPGKLWEFNQYYETYQPPLSINQSGGLSGFPRIDANSNGTVDLTNTEGGSANISDEHGDAWVAELKNVSNGAGRDARWRHVNAVNGDNAFIVSETAGLVFNTGVKGFFIRNDRVKHNCWGHVGIRQNGSSFTIPQLTAGDIIEINWKRESGGSGGIFSATNVTDLRHKPVNENFEITGSQIGTTGGVMDIYKNPGYTSFIATGGDVTFTLRDGGATDILSIRIYSGGYHSTMRDITASDHSSPQTTMLLDNSYKEYEYDYCNVLNSTNTGPAIYVLKGYMPGEDNVECVSGSNAGLTPVAFSDNDATYPAYPVTEAESARLYALRKNLQGFRMYNRTWQSSRNSYNNGKIGASGGWGKVTIRMNNYTNDMKYVIGYTNDVTMTIGAAPHQTYPYTWDFTKIAGQTVTGKTDNVLFSIETEGSLSTFSGQAPTNWIKREEGQFILNTDNSGDLGSQYVPGAVLVSTERALSKYPNGTASTTYALDELDGLGFAGEITMHIDHLPSDLPSSWNRSEVEINHNSLLSFKITDYAIFTKTGGTDEEPEGDWSFSDEEQAAGNGTIQLNSNCSLDVSPIPNGGIGYRLDDGDTKYIKIILGSPLQVGDIINVTAYNAYNYRDAGICFNLSNSKDDVAQSMMLSDRLVEETLSYTVATNDRLDGKSVFYIYRNTNTVHVTAVEITRSASAIPNLDWSVYTLSRTAITIPDLNADGKQDWIYVSATKNPRRVVNYDSAGENEINLSRVTDATGGGPDANTNVYKYKVSQPGNVNLIFDEDTKIYKIGVTHILKEIHPVGGTGWATEIRNQDIDHELIGYFTKNDVNAYTVKYDSYDMKTATVALTPINEDGYVKAKTGIVMKLDNVADLSDANGGKNVPLFYPSYTRDKSSTSVDFPANNLMYNVDEGIENDNRNYNEEIFNYNGTNVNYTKFILTNKYWTFDKDHALSTDEAATQHAADVAGFYRMHIWKTGDVVTKNTMPAHTAYLLVPSDNLPAAVWTLQSGYSAARETTLGVYNIIGPNSATGIENIEQTPGLATDEENTAEDGDWYTLSGVKLPKRPTKEGLYVWRSVEGDKNGRMVSVNPRGR